MKSDFSKKTVHIPREAKEWDEIPEWALLSSICDGIFDCPHSTPKITSIGPFVVRSQDIRTGIFKKHLAAHVSDETYLLRIARATPQYGDLFYSREGTYFGIAAEVPQNTKVCLGQRMVLIRPQKTHNHIFLKYWLNSPIMVNYVASFRDGTVAERLNMPTIRALPIPVFARHKQDNIASILSSLDDKIELNRRTNETLEAMARALFRDWFVDFGPTRAKMAGEASYLAPELWELFPDRLDDEGKPEGWHQKPISEHFSVSIGKTPPRKEREHFVSSGHGIPWLSIRDMGTGNVFVSTTSENLTPESVERFNIKIASEGTVLLSFKLTVGRVMIANQRISTNEAIAHLFSKKVPTNYTYCYLKNFDFDTLGSTSSIATAVNSQTIRDMPFLIPSNSILDEFSLITERIFEKLFINEKENNNLSQFRDLLLPKLMSGEISVRDAEKMVEDVT